MAGISIGVELDGASQHHFADDCRRLVDYDQIDWQYSLEAVIAINHEHLVSMAGQFIKAAQVTRNRPQRHILTHLHDVEVHHCADRIRCIGNRRTQLLTLLYGERLEHVTNHILG